MNDTHRPDDTGQPLAPDQQLVGVTEPAEPGGRWRCALEELPSAPGRTGRVAVVGAGMVGLATAWFLQERGVDVDVLERNEVAAGSSWGNAGWLAPALTTPLPEPAVLRYGIRAALDPASPVYVPISLEASLWRFLAGFARNCTTRRWRRGMAAYRGVNRQALDAFDELAAGGVEAPTQPADPFLVCFSRADERARLLEELGELERIGQKLGFDVLTGEQARERAPILTEHVAAAVQLHDQRFIDPPRYLAALADAVRGAGPSSARTPGSRTSSTTGSRCGCAPAQGCTAMTRP